MVIAHKLIPFEGVRKSKAHSFSIFFSHEDLYMESSKPATDTDYPQSLLREDQNCVRSPSVNLAPFAWMSSKREHGATGYTQSTEAEYFGY